MDDLLPIVLSVLEVLIPYCLCDSKPESFCYIHVHVLRNNPKFIFSGSGRCTLCFFLRCIGSETTWRISPWSGQGCWKEEERSEFCVYSVNICVLFLNSWNTSSPRSSSPRSSSDVMCALYHYRRRSVNTRHPFQRGLGRRRSLEDLRRPTSYRKVHIESLTFHCTM